jgi:2-hydroxycyclohexanecarboxyl-CoA dehydrogenase
MQGRIALITGGAGGIGAATAELFCAQQAKVLIVDRDAGALQQQVETIRGRVSTAAIESYIADVTNPAEAAAAVSHAVKTFGALNVLVSNAAVRYLSSVADADTVQWEKVLSVNLLGAVNMSKAAMPELRRSGNAAIVILSSTYALVGRRDFGAYDASKAALLSLTRTLAFEGAGHGIRVNAVCPGGTLTPFTVGRAKGRGASEADLRREAKPDALLKRWGEAFEIAYPILWLASNEASFVTGATLAVDGGTSIM